MLFLERPKRRSSVGLTRSSLCRKENLNAQMRSVQSGILDTGCSEPKHRAYRDFALTGDLAAEVDDATHPAKSLNFGTYP